MASITSISLSSSMAMAMVPVGSKKLNEDLDLIEDCRGKEGRSGERGCVLSCCGYAHSPAASNNDCRSPMLRVDARSSKSFARSTGATMP